MTKKQTRLSLVAAALALGVFALLLMRYALNDAVVFFYTPSEIHAKRLAPGARIRIGGLVEQGSLTRGENGKVNFRITDTAAAIAVSYQGILPDLFREGQGVVAEGVATTDGGFLADRVLAKHDETYMPKEVMDKLKAQGLWRDGKRQP